MDRDYFQKAILHQMKGLLDDGKATLAHVQEIAQRALDVSRDPHVSHETVLAFLEEYPEVSGQLLVTLKNEDSEARAETVGHIRQLLDHHQNIS